jgi:20S proteasome alpha/beta subunit
MTLIIGFKCKDGVALVSDTKITDVETGESTYNHKIFTPIPNTQFIIGAAGYTHLFQEFNRKVPLVFTEKLNEHLVKNIKSLIEQGMTREQAFDYIQKLQVKIQQMQQNAISSDETKTDDDLPIAVLPYVYNGERFLDDCKTLTKEISSQRKEEPFPLEVFLGLKQLAYSPTLHYINWLGKEQSIERYAAIGSGSPHVKMFFEEFYDFNKSMLELIALAFANIVYVQNIAKNSGVGYTDEWPPEAVAIYNNGAYGRIRFLNEKEELNKLKKHINKSFRPKITNLKLPKLTEKPPETT